MTRHLRLLRGLRWSRLAVVAAGLMALVSLAHADAPSDQYGLFDSNSEVISDQETRLIWQRSALTTTLNLADATSYCSALSLGGVNTGSRIPSYKELLTLVDEAPHTEYENGTLVDKAIDPNAFPGTAIDNAYWTSSPYNAQSGYAFAVNFHTGISQGQDVTTLLYVRCVR